MAKKGYYFVTKNNKRNLILMLVILVIACVILAVISLLPNKFKDKWLNTDNGVARSTMFPFVYTSDNELFVMDENLKSTEIDDSVAACIHDVNFNTVFYLRDSNLYEYDIDTNVRKRLSSGVVNYRLFTERTAILCTNNINDIYLYLYKDKGNLKLNKDSLENVHVDNLYLIGKECIVFLDNYNSVNNTASLMYSDLTGTIKCIAKDVDITRNFYISSDDNYLSYYKNNRMIISDMNGKVLKEYDSAKIIIHSRQPVLTELCTTVKYYSDGIDFSYFLVNISENGSNGDLVFFDNEFKSIDQNIRSVVYFCEDDNMVLYTKNAADGKVDLFKCFKGGNPEHVISCSSSDTFFFNEDLSYLYIQSSEGYLRRTNIFDADYKITDIAEGSGVMYEYIGKSFIGYHNLDGDTQYLILNTNVIEEISMNEVRHYGKFSDRYLLTRENGTGTFSLDFVIDGKFTRISNEIDKNVFFDKEFKNVIYSYNGTMYIFKDNVSTEIGNCINLNAVPIISSR